MREINAAVVVFALACVIGLLKSILEIVKAIGTIITGEVD